MDSAEVERRRIITLNQIREVIKKLDLEVLTSDNNPDYEKEMLEDDFREVVLNFPVVIPPDCVMALIKHYKKGKMIDYDQFIHDLLETELTNHKVESPSKKKTNPDYERLARYLYYRGTDLRTVFSSADKIRSGKVTVDQFCRGLFDFPDSMTICKSAMDKRTKEIDYRSLQISLDSIDLKFIAREVNDPIDKLPELISKFIYMVRSRGIILQDVFLKTEITKSGFMVPNRFLVTIRNLRLPLSIQELQEITQFFTKEDMIDFKRFLKITEHFMKDDYVPPPPPIDLEVAKTTLFDFFNKRRLNIWSLFKPFDRTGKGIIQKSIFLNTIIKLHFDMKESDIKFVVDSFTMEDGKSVNYIDFAKEVYSKRNISFDQTIDAVLQRMRNYVIEKGIRLSKYLSAYDREKSGQISTSQFIAAIRRSGFELNEKDLALIRDHYEDKKTKHYILWTLLCQEVDVVPLSNLSTQTSALQFSPSMRDVLTSSRMMSTYSANQPRSSNPRESRPVPDQLIPLYGQIFKRMMDYGIDIGDELIRKDKLKKGYVTQALFRQSISMLGLKISPEDLSDLSTFYTDEASGNVYYTQFLQDVEEFGNLALPMEEEDDNNEEEINEISISRTTRLSESTSGINPEILVILSRIKEMCKRKQLEPLELFSPFDMSKTGTVPESKLLQILDRVDIRLNEGDEQIMINEFRDLSRPENLNYLRLCNAIQGASFETTRTFEKPLSQDDEQRIDLTIHRLQNTLKNRRSSFRKLFSNLPMNTIDINGFRKRLEIAEPTISNDIVRLLYKRYRVSDEELNWIKFVEDSEKQRLIF